MKYSKIFLALLGIGILHISTEVAEVRADFLQDGIDVTSAQAGAFEATVNLAIWNDVSRCYKYSMVLVQNFVDLVKLAFVDIFQSLSEFTLIIHKLPLVVKECIRPVDDIEYIDAIFAQSKHLNTFDFWTHLFENFIFNIGDLFQNGIEAHNNLSKRDFNSFGKNVGQMIIDTFYINPLDKD